MDDKANGRRTADAIVLFRAWAVFFSNVVARELDKNTLYRGVSWYFRESEKSEL